MYVCGLTVFENKDKIVIVMEYASRGDLYDYICEKQRISEREARHFFRQIVSAVHYCHRVRCPFSYPSQAKVQGFLTRHTKLAINVMES